MTTQSRTIALVSACILIGASLAFGQVIKGRPAGKWLMVTGSAAGTDANAKDEAKSAALRKAVEQGCGVFIKAQSQTRNYKVIYDKIFADAVGYVREYKVVKVWTGQKMTHVTIRAFVSAQKFEKDWATIAHTVHREGNPRVIVVIAETTEEMVNTLANESESSTTSTEVHKVESEATVTSAQVARAIRDGDTYCWYDQGRRGWRRRRRTGRIYCTTHQEVTAAQTAAARAHFAAIDTRIAAIRSKASNKVWKRVAENVSEKGAVQGRIEDFFLKKGIRLMDRGTVRKVNKRDLALAMGKGDTAEVAALGAKFGADVIILGTASAKYSKEIPIGQAKLYQYTSKLVVRVIRTDSGQLMVSKVFGPVTHNSTLKTGGKEKALDKLATASAPKLLSAVVEAWRKQAHVRRAAKGSRGQGVAAERNHRLGRHY